MLIVEAGESGLGRGGVCLGVCLPPPILADPGSPILTESPRRPRSYFSGAAMTKTPEVSLRSN